jgi:putative SOS response-associated peptidase YedK
MTFSTSAEVPPNFNVAPTHQVPVVRDYDGKREGVLMRWGLIPSWAKDKKMAQINARGDTIATKPMFRAAFKKRRCLIVADGYYEWKKVGKEKQPFLYRTKTPFAFAGLWEYWDEEKITSCTIITTDANELASQVHDRMPVLLGPESWEPWLDPAVEPAALQSLLVPFPPGKMEAFAVSPSVNSVKNNGPELIVPG